MCPVTEFVKHLAAVGINSTVVPEGETCLILQVHGRVAKSNRNDSVTGIDITEFSTRPLGIL